MCFDLQELSRNETRDMVESIIDAEQREDNSGFKKRLEASAKEFGSTEDANFLSSMRSETALQTTSHSLKSSEITTGLSQATINSFSPSSSVARDERSGNNLGSAVHLWSQNFLSHTRSQHHSVVLPRVSDEGESKAQATATKTRKARVRLTSKDVQRLLENVDLDKQRSSITGHANLMEGSRTRQKLDDILEKRRKVRNVVLGISHCR